MKFYISYFVLVLGLLLSSCGSDENPMKENEMDSEIDPKVEMKICSEDIATGVINGKEFSFTLGFATPEPHGGYSIYFYAADGVALTCWFNSLLSIFGTMPELSVGKTDLSVTDSDGQTLTMFDPDGFVNTLAVEGYIEFTSVTDKIAEGHMYASDGRGDLDYVCGTFSIDICQ